MDTIAEVSQRGTSFCIYDCTATIGESL
jgi:hypothetical protein